MRMRECHTAEVNTMIDPQAALRVMQEYYATATDKEIIDDLRRFSPELAEHFGVGLVRSRAADGEEKGRAPDFQGGWTDTAAAALLKHSHRAAGVSDASRTEPSTVGGP
jgi:hypothetical protein